MPNQKDKIDEDGSVDTESNNVSALLGQAKDQAQSLMSDVDARQDDATNTTAGGNVGAGNTGGENEFLSTLQDRLLGQSGMVSSSDSDLQASIQDAVNQVQVSQEASAEAIESRFDQQIQDAQQQGVQQARTQREGSGGFATQLAALREVTSQTDDRIAQLERQREQALLQNRSQAADRIQDMIVREQELEQQQRQNVMSNLLQVGQMQQSQQRFQTRIGQQQTQFEERQQRLREQQQFQEAQSRIEFLNNNNLISGASQQQKRQLEQQYGLPNGTLDKVEDKEELNLSSVSGVGLVNVSRDEEGNVQSEVIMPSQETGDSNLDLSDIRANRNAAVQQTLTQNMNPDTGTLNGVQPYMNAKQQFVNSGGTLNDFLQEFPPSIYLGKNQQKKIPEGWQEASQQMTAASLW